MKLNDRNMPGPGDPETWPPYSGHPLDPRAPLEYEPTLAEYNEAAIEIVVEECEVFKILAQMDKKDNEGDFNCLNELLELKCTINNRRSVEKLIVKFEEFKARLASHANDFYGDAIIEERAIENNEKEMEALSEY